MSARICYEIAQPKTPSRFSVGVSSEFDILLSSFGSLHEDGRSVVTLGPDDCRMLRAMHTVASPHANLTPPTSLWLEIAQTIERLNLGDGDNVEPVRLRVWCEY